MTAPAWFWIVFTVVAALAQTYRNAFQRELTGPLGTVGATLVRFLYGLPFGAAFLLVALALTGEGLPRIPPIALVWTALGAVTQILGTAMILAAMQLRSFLVVTAYTKTEPVQVALFGLVLLGDHLSIGVTLAILVATAGVTLMSWPRKGGVDAFSWPSLALGLGAAGMLGFASVAYRGTIMALGTDSFVLAAMTTLVMTLSLQTTLLVGWLGWRDRKTLRAIFGEWRRSLPAGLMGAVASGSWYLAFALESAARVRTLALVEIFFAQIVSRQMFRQTSSLREWGGIALIVAGVIWLLNG